MKTDCYVVPAELIKKNPHVRFYQIDGKEFKPYGKLLDLNTKNIISLADKITSINPESNTYVALEPQLQKDPLKKNLSLHFGGISIQIGYCNGPNRYLNSMEYHKSPELFIAVTDSIQFLTSFQYLNDFNNISTEHAKAFYFPKGSAAIVNPYVLHFSPCAVYKNGFKSIIVLPRGTNAPLGKNLLRISKSCTEKEAKLLFAQNKWLITHKENKKMVERGAFIGISGVNLHIIPID